MHGFVTQLPYPSRFFTIWATREAQSHRELKVNRASSGEKKVKDQVGTQKTMGDLCWGTVWLTYGVDGFSQRSLHSTPHPLSSSTVWLASGISWKVLSRLDQGNLGIFFPHQFFALIFWLSFHSNLGHKQCVNFHKPRVSHLSVHREQMTHFLFSLWILYVRDSVYPTNGT